MAGRYLLCYLFADFPLELIQIADTRKPFLEDEAYHFSISHCGDYAAAIISKTSRVGIDIETFSEKVQRIRHKFISEGEDAILNTQYSIFNRKVENKNSSNSQSTGRIINLLTLLWSCKEAVFKWYGLGNMDFREDMQVYQLEAIDTHSFKTMMHFKKDGDLSISLHSQFFESLCLSYIIT